MRLPPFTAWAAAVAAGALACGALAQTVRIERTPYGSGEPGQGGAEAAVRVENNIYHAPQYLPGYPTAASLWPRVIRVQCQQAGDALQCDGYHWAEWMGRAEYLYFTPVIAAVPAAPPGPR